VGALHVVSTKKSLLNSSLLQMHEMGEKRDKAE